MSVDKFGRHEDFFHIKQNNTTPRNTIHFTPDGNYDIRSKLLRNIGVPVADNDAVNMGYIKQNCMLKISKKESSSENGNGGYDENFDASSKQIKNLGDGVNETDAVNIRTLTREINRKMREHQLRLDQLSSTLFQFMHQQKRLNPRSSNMDNSLDMIKKTIHETPPTTLVKFQN
jgi:hypothetical protein